MDVVISNQLKTNDPPRLVIKLNRRESGALDVLACEVLSEAFTNRTVFHGSTKLVDVLSDHVVDVIENALRGIGPQRQLISLPNLMVQLPNLVLAKAQILISEMVDGAQNVIFRFMGFLGTLDGVLKHKTSTGTVANLTAERMAVRVLDDLALPLLNLVRHETSGSARNDRAHQNLSDNAHEIEFRVELLKRFVLSKQGARDALEPEYS